MLRPLVTELRSSPDLCMAANDDQGVVPRRDGVTSEGAQDRLLLLLLLGAVL